jgi:DNA-binding PadR family transcriptional regulator
MTVLGKSEPSIINALKNLTEKGLIVKVPVIVNNAKRHYYKTTNTLDEATLKNLSNPTLKILSNPTLKNLSHNINSNNIKKSISNDIQKESVSKSRFQKPKIEEVEAYIKEKKMHFDAVEFYDYYEAVGWMVGKKHMKDWKAACRTWENNRKDRDHNEEEQPKELPAGMSAEVWEKCKVWFNICTPRICGYITPEAYMAMKNMTNDKKVMTDIIRYIEVSGYRGDIVKEFSHLLETGEYKEGV